MSRRDPVTGRLTHPVSINIHLNGEMLPRLFSATSWAAAGAFFSSAEFKEIAERVDSVTISHSGVVA